MTTTHHIRCNGSTHYVKGNAPHQSLPVFEGMATGDNNILPSAMFTSMVKVHGFRFLIFTIGFGKACNVLYMLPSRLCQIAKSTMPNCLVHIANSPLPRCQLHITKETLPNCQVQICSMDCPNELQKLPTKF